MNAKYSSESLKGASNAGGEARSELRQKAEALLEEITELTDTSTQVNISLNLTKNDLLEIRELACEGLQKLTNFASLDDFSLQMLGHSGEDINRFRNRASSALVVIEKLDSLIASNSAPSLERLRAIQHAAAQAADALEEKGVSCSDRLPTSEDANSNAMVEWLRSGIWMRGAFNEQPVDATRWRPLPDK